MQKFNFCIFLWAKSDRTFFVPICSHNMINIIGTKYNYITIFMIESTHQIILYFSFDSPHSPKQEFEFKYECCTVGNFPRNTI